MSDAVFLPLMTHDQPDTAERMRLRVYEIPFALPEKRSVACKHCMGWNWARGSVHASECPNFEKREDGE